MLKSYVIFLIRFFAMILTKRAFKILQLRAVCGPQLFFSKLTCTKLEFSSWQWITESYSIIAEMRSKLLEGRTDYLNCAQHTCCARVYNMPPGLLELASMHFKYFSLFSHDRRTYFYLINSNSTIGHQTPLHRIWTRSLTVFNTCYAITRPTTRFFLFIYYFKWTTSVCQFVYVRAVAEGERAPTQFLFSF